MNIKQGSGGTALDTDESYVQVYVKINEFSIFLTNQLLYFRGDQIFVDFVRFLIHKDNLLFCMVF